MTAIEEASPTTASSRPTRDPLLRVRDLKVTYPIRKGVFSRTVGAVRAVDGVSFDVYPGETLGVVGESGCGKSTAGRAIIGLEAIDEGTVEFEGHDIGHASGSELRSLRREFQMVFQDPFSSLNPQKRIGDLLMEPLIAHGIAARRDAREAAAKTLEIVGLDESFGYRYPHELSGGQRQRIGVARALMLRPKLIVCDEPVSALDVSIQAQVLNLLKRLQEELSLTYLFITHGLGVVKYISDRIVVMYLGKVMEIGTTEEIFDHPRHPYTEILLSAYPVPNPVGRERRERIIARGEVPSAAKPPSGCVFHTRCPFAKERCRTEVPTLRGGDHAFACHYPLEVGRGAPAPEEAVA